MNDIHNPDTTARDTAADISYVRGDATDPIGTGPKVIAHVCNDIGAWGAGFSGAITRRWKRPEQEYRDWYAASKRHPGSALAFSLGNTWFMPLGAVLWVASMVAQSGIRGPGNPKPIRYDALAACLGQVGAFARSGEAITSAHMPRIGCGLAGGSWGSVEPLIREHLTGRGIAVTVYDLLTEPPRSTYGES